MTTLYVYSLPDSDECPHRRGRVRANMIILGFIFKPVVDESTGAEATEVFFV